jgi:phosphatidylserine/phosphatidylglycerophosphate/cardiolipin synthase-like enzyme
MRFKSSDNETGYTVYAVSGVRVVSFAIDSGNADTKGLLGFAVERHDYTEDERYYMRGFKVFREVYPNPSPHLEVTTYDQPIQSFVWDDLTAKPDHKYDYFFHPLKGKPKNLERLPPVKISVLTEPEHSATSEHDVFFNRGVASSQAYEREFNNLSPDDPSLTPDQRQERLDWLGRGLDKAICDFIKQAQAGDALRACLYEFRYLPVAQEFSAAVARGVDVKIIFDAKLNLQDPGKCAPLSQCRTLKAVADFKDILKAKQEAESSLPSKDRDECFPRCANLPTIAQAQIPEDNLIRRQANEAHIQHNKFIVYLKNGQTPTAVWTGSTNISEGGIFGQTNVGHWVRNEAVAAKYFQYWNLLRTDPGVQPGDSGKSGKGKEDNVAFKRQVVDIQGDIPLAPGTGAGEIPQGTTPIFSPRTTVKMLKTYAQLLDNSKAAGCVTLPFGVSKALKDVLADNTTKSPLIFMLLEKKDQKRPRSKGPFVMLTARNNVYEAWGAYMRGKSMYQWARETNTQILKLNGHVMYVHSKFLLHDPLSDDPIVVSGSANFSDGSTTANDENMLLIRGDLRAADIYFTEFMRIFNHYYFRAVHEATAKPNDGDNVTQDDLFLKSTDVWLEKYRPGSLRAKRVAMFVNMKGFVLS